MGIAMMTAVVVPLYGELLSRASVTSIVWRVLSELYKAFCLIPVCISFDNGNCAGSANCLIQDRMRNRWELRVH